MTNRDIAYTWKYHDGTKHSFESVRSIPHYLDWANQPRTYKIYATAESIALPEEPDTTDRSVLSAISVAGACTRHDTPFCLKDLAGILHFSAGVTRRRPYPGGEVLFRAAACTGALYAIELYVVCGDIPDLSAGVYLFSPVDNSLKILRQGDYRSVLAEAAAGDVGVRHAPATIVSTGTYWRNAWKYRGRTYRHFGWDNGTILANLLAVAVARELPARVLNGFRDEAATTLLGLEVTREVALSLVPVGHSGTPCAKVRGEIAPLELEVVPYSAEETDYPEMREMHDASSLLTAREVAGWRRPKSAPAPPAPPEKLIPLEPFTGSDLPDDGIERVIRRRGSSRSFMQKAISFSQLSTALYFATQGVPADFIHPAGSQLNDIYLICHAVEGLEPGSYFLHRNPWGLEMLKQGDFREQTGILGLEQELPADCSAAVFFMANLNPILELFGNRGYRAAQLEAGIIGGRLYLAAYGQRLGATGLTFYDDEVTNFFSPHAAGKSAIFLVALGHSAKRQAAT